MIRELTTYLAGRLGLEIGTSIFAGWRGQGAADVCVTVLESSGDEPFDEASHVFQGVQILTRGGSYFEARELAQTAHDALYGKANAGLTLPVVDSGPTWLVNSVVGSRPQHIGIDKKGRAEFSANYTLRAQAL